MPAHENSAPLSDLRAAESAFQKKEYDAALATYHKIITNYPSSPESADAMFATGYLLAYQDNPQRDFHQALTVFEEFIKKYPDHPKVAEAQNWRAVIKMLIEIRKENERLNRSIEQLKKLDVKHEERRTR
jgi:outer membrane protein assembly factor BamD (BamD/ComL family)